MFARWSFPSHNWLWTAQGCGSSDMIYAPHGPDGRKNRRVFFPCLLAFSRSLFLSLSRSLSPPTHKMTFRLLWHVAVPSVITLFGLFYVRSLYVPFPRLPPPSLAYTGKTEFWIVGQRKSRRKLHWWEEGSVPGMHTRHSNRSGWGFCLYAASHDMCLQLRVFAYCPSSLPLAPIDMCLFCLRLVGCGLFFCRRPGRGPWSPFKKRRLHPRFHANSLWALAGREWMGD